MSTGHILIAPTAFKGTLFPVAAARAMADGVRAATALPVVLLPLADGGDGFVEVLASRLPTPVTEVTVPACHADLFDQRVPVAWPWHDTAILSTADAAGLASVPPEFRNPLHTSTSGLGEAMRIAIARGARHLIVGLGGSATCDGGVGALGPLGFVAWDASGAPAELHIARLHEIQTLSPAPGDDSPLASVHWTFVADVMVPALGEAGGIRAFAPQKGASPDDTLELERRVEHWIDLLERQTGIRIRTMAGGGAAGGVALPFAALFPSRVSVVPGFDYVWSAMDGDRELAGARLVLTGEGAIDATSGLGKVIGPLAAKARAAGVPVAAVAGRVDGDISAAARALGLVSLAACGRTPSPAEALALATAQAVAGV